MTHTEWLQILWGLIGTVGFGVLFNIRGMKLVVAASGGLLSWLLFLLLGHVIDNDTVNYFIVALCLSLYAELMARLLKTPTSVFVTTSLVPLIPGSSLYYTMASAFGGDFAAFLERATATLLLASALALGIIAATTAVRLITHRHRIFDGKFDGKQ